MKGGVFLRLEYLEYFVTVARCGSINQAARQLYISQPHLSRIIRDMEQDTGTVLLERRSQGVALTPDGEFFLLHAQRILDEMKQLNSLGSRKVSAGHTLNVSMTKYSHIMEAFNEVCRKHQQDDAICYRLNEGTFVEVMNDVVEGFADVGVLHTDSTRLEESLSLFEGHHLNYVPLTTARPHIIIAAGHSLIREGRPVTLETLKPYGFVRYIGKYEDFTYQLMSQDSQADLNSSRKIVYTFGRASLLHLISISDFYSIGIQSFDGQQPLYDILSIPVDGAMEGFEFGYITRRGTALTPIVSEFICTLRARFPECRRPADMA